ncbi:hypothetical protein NEUTE2DRAFT_49536 [Neurospora tetrasperma FGSC 2509]|nr:hypothetical protein NEUTE2DRAFT_49536 [Neurospora tetrasperma FGSC 2509]
MSQPTLYEILSLSPTTSDLTPAIIKQAYRRALLTHHPDNHPPPKTKKPISYTIDQISLAYTTLSSPTLRTQYDASLRRLAASSRTHPTTTLGKGNVVEDFQTGIDTIDLDDMVFVPSYSNNGKEKDTWYRPCRCGNERGFALTEEDLEENADLGEVLVQCADCTIWLRVCYVVAENDDDDKEEEEKGDGDDEEKRKR